MRERMKNLGEWEKQVARWLRLASGQVLIQLMKVESQMFDKVLW